MSNKIILNKRETLRKMREVQKWLNQPDTQKKIKNVSRGTSMKGFQKSLIEIFTSYYKQELKEEKGLVVIDLETDLNIPEEFKKLVFKWIPPIEEEFYWTYKKSYNLCKT